MEVRRSHWPTVWLVILVASFARHILSALFHSAFVEWSLPALRFGFIALVIIAVYSRISAVATPRFQSHPLPIFEEVFPQDNPLYDDDLDRYPIRR